MSVGVLGQNLVRVVGSFPGRGTDVRGVLVRDEGWDC